MKSMRCIVTGGAGFIGSHVADLLVSEGHSVKVLDNLSTGNLNNINKKCELHEVDIRNPDQLAPHFKNVDWVFHLAALPRIQPSFDEPVEHEVVNVVGTLNVVKASMAAGVKRFVISASSACYGTPLNFPTTEEERIDPLSPYALQKYAAERSALLLGDRFGLPVVALRYFNVYGPRSYSEKNPFNAYTSVIGIFNAQKNKGASLTVTGDGSQERDFIHVHDVAKANLKAAQAAVSGQVFNVGFGRTYSILDVAKKFNHPYTFIPERLGESRITHADTSKAEKYLGWKAEIDLDKGIGLN